MTARANSLTDRAMMPAPTLRVFVNGLRTLGYDAETLLAAAGVSAAELGDPDGRIACGAFGAVLAGAERQRVTPNLALALAEVTPPGAWPLLDYLVATSDTVGAGVRQLARYFEVTGDAIAFTIREDADAVRVEIAAVSPFAVEYEAALTVVRLRAETDGRFAAAGLSFQHTLDDAGAFARAVGCPIAQRAPWSGITLSADAWRLPLQRRDPILREVLEGHANGILVRLPARNGFAHDIQRALASRIAGGDTSIESLGRALAMSPRTLQRRLAAEGVSFQKLLEEARKEAAGRYLADETLSVGEVAYLLGYAEPAPFHRAFKRWFGKTPEAFRRARA